MSAYIVGKQHIDALLRVALEGPADRAPQYPGNGWHGHRYFFGGLWRDVREDMDRVGQVLVDENVRSVQYRYNGESVDTLPGPVEKEFVDSYQYPMHGTGPVRIAAGPRRLTAVEALKALDGYEYQSCETPDWESTEAYAFVKYMRGSVVMALPGYDEAETWEVR